MAIYWLNSCEFACNSHLFIPDRLAQNTISYNGAIETVSKEFLCFLVIDSPSNHLNALLTPHFQHVPENRQHNFSTNDNDKDVDDKCD